MQQSKAAKVNRFGVPSRSTSRRKKRPTGTVRKSTRPQGSTHAPKVQRNKKEPTVLTFRERTQSDDDYILQLTEDQLGSVHQSAFGEPFPRQQFLQYIQSGAPTMIVESQGKRLGYYSYLIGPDGKMHISAMVIEPHFQSSGVGTQVMKRLEADAAARGVHTLEVFVQANNEKSLAFTRKLGFNETFRLEPNTIVFQKQLQRINSQPAVTASNAPGFPNWPYPPMY